MATQRDASRQPTGVREANGRGGTSRQEASSSRKPAAPQDYERQRLHCKRTKERGRGGGGATRCNATTSQGKVKVNGRRTIPPPPSKNCGDDLEEEVRQKRREHDNGQLQRRGEKDGGSGDDSDDIESLDGVAAASLLSDANASGDKDVI